MKITGRLVLQPLILSLAFWATLAVGVRGDDNLSKANNGVTASSAASAVTLDHIDGLHTYDTILTGQDIVMYFRVLNATEQYIGGFTHGFRLYSPDSANWDTTSARYTGAIERSMLDLILVINQFSVSGTNADTIGYGGAKLGGTGIPPGFDEIVFTIKVGPIALSEAGKSLCIDSSWYPPSNIWTWSWSGGGTKPAWEGARCFRIANPPPWPDTLLQGD